MIASQRHGDAPDPCSVPRTQSSAFENLSSESPKAVFTLYFICCSVWRRVETDEELAPRRQRAIPPTDGIILSKVALQSLLKMMADFLQRDSPSYESRFRRIASVEDLLGRDPHCVNGMFPQSSAL